MAREALPVHPLTKQPLTGPLKPGEICPVCAKCCKYVCIEVDSPTSVKAVSNLLWYLYHRNVAVFMDAGGDWAVAFEGTCEHLTPDGLCGIYEHRPLICRDYDVRHCEGTAATPVEKHRFTRAHEFTDWLRLHKPRVFARCKARGIIPLALLEREGPAGQR